MVYSIDMNKDVNKKNLKKLTKAQLISLLLKQQKIDKLKSQAIALSRWLNEYEDVIQPPEQFRDAYKPIPPLRIAKWKT